MKSTGRKRKFKHRTRGPRILAAALGLGLGALMAGCQGNPQVAARAFVQKGGQYASHGKLPEAAIEFRNALQREPQDWQARYQLARVENQMQQWPECYRDLEQVVSENPSFVPARLDLAELYVAASQYDQAQSQIDRARRLSPKNARTELIEMKLYLSRGAFPLAATQCKTLERLAPDRDQPYALCGLADLGLRQYPAAQQNFELALRLGPKNVENYTNLANLLDWEGQTQHAETLLDSGIAKLPGSLDMDLALADFYVRHGRLANADALFARLGKRQSEFPDLAVKLGNFWMWRNELPRAIAEFQAAEASHPNALVETNLASAYLTLHQNDSAERFTADVVRRDPESAAAKALEGALAYGKGDYAQASELLEAAHKDDPHSLFSEFYLGMTWLATGQLDRAKQAFSDCIAANEDFVEAYVRLGQIALESGDWRLGAAYGRRVLTIDPGAVDGYLLLAQADMIQGDLSAAGGVIEAAEKTGQPSLPLGQVAIRYDILRRDFAQAEQQFQALTQDASPSPALLAWYIAQLASSGQTSLAISRTQQWLDRSPRDPAANELLAKLYFEKGDLRQAESSVRASLGSDPRRSGALQLLGEIFERQGKLAEAEQEYDSAIQANPGNIQGYLLAGNLRMQQGAYTEAQPYFEAARIHAPDSDAAKLALARCWAEQDIDLNQSLGLAQNLKAAYPGNPIVADTLGWIYHERGLDALAKAELQMAARALPGDASVQFHWGMILIDEKKMHLADQALETALQLGLPHAEQAIANHALAAAKTGNVH